MFRPTPAKSHYLFNLRDVHKLVQGILQADSGTVREAKPMLRLFYHEALRCFQDRLNCYEDKSQFQNMMHQVSVCLASIIALRSLLTSALWLLN